MTAPEPHIVPVTFDVPESIPRSKLMTFLADLGIPTSRLLELHIGRDGVYIEVLAVNSSGGPYVAPGTDEAATHRIAIPLDWSA